MVETEPLKQQLASEYQLAERQYLIAGQSITLFNVANNFDLLDRLSEEFQRDERMPYWAEIWPASLALAEWVLTQPQFYQSHCLELGAGVGTVSIAAARAGAQIVTTDYFPDALDFAQLNAAVNQVRIATLLMDWRDIALEAKFDYVLAADVLYERRNHRPVLQAIAQLLAEDGVAYVSDPQRAIAAEFQPLVAEYHLNLETLVHWLEWEGQKLAIDIHVLSHS